MSRSLNAVFLLGRLGKDAETRFAPSGTAKTTFSVATERRWKDQASGEWKSETDWHNVVLWRSENLANYLTKGTQVHVQGRLSTRSYDDKNGEKRWVTEVVADSVALCGSGNQQSGGDSRPAGRQSQTAGGFEPGITDDDCPF